MHDSVLFMRASGQFGIQPALPPPALSASSPSKHLPCMPCRYDPLNLGVPALLCPLLERLVFTCPLHGGRLQQGMADAGVQHLGRLQRLTQLKARPVPASCWFACLPSCLLHLRLKHYCTLCLAWPHRELCFSQHSITWP